MVYKEFYLNGNLKELSKATYHTRVPIKKHKFYNKKGGLIKEIDYEGQINVKFDKAVEIAEREGMKKPFELNISKDSLYWEILIWKRIEFDSITNRGVDAAVGLSINRTSGETKVIERQRKFVI